MTPNLFDLYFEYTADTESPVIYHRWSLLTSLSAALGRNVWLPFGPGRIFPNQYVILVGSPGVRKSSAIKMAKNVLAKSGFRSFAADKTRQEKFLEDLAMDDQLKEESDDGLALLDLDLDEKVAKEVFVVADEFNLFMGQNNLDFMTILGSLWDWDSEEIPFRYRLKNSKSVNIWQPTLSILGGNTPVGMLEAFPPAALGQGFMSRLLLIYSDTPNKKIAFPTEPDAELARLLEAKLREIRQSIRGPMQMTAQAKSALELIYKTWPPLEDSRFLSYSTRRFTHLLKLCMLVAAANLSMEITKDHVVEANTVLAYAELHMPKALGEIGKSRTSEAANKIMQVLYAAHGPVSMLTLWKTVASDLDKQSDLSQVLANLKAAQKIQEVTGKTIKGGSHSIGFVAVQGRISREVQFYVESYLYGRELPLRVNLENL